MRSQNHRRRARREDCTYFHAVIRADQALVALSTVSGGRGIAASFVIMINRMNMPWRVAQADHVEFDEMEYGNIAAAITCICASTCDWSDITSW